MSRIVLASASPRRKELLEQIGLEFEVLTSDAPEITSETEPAEIVKDLSRQKAMAVKEQWEKTKSPSDAVRKKHPHPRGRYRSLPQRADPRQTEG